MKRKDFYPFLFSVLLAVMACSLPFNRRTETPSPFPPGSASSEDTPGETGAAPMPASPVPPEPQLGITRIAMFTANNGWALATIPGDQNDHLLVTRDGGATWRDVTPPETLAAEPVRAAAFFLDAGTAWITFAYQNSFVIPEDPSVWQTTDGGETWIELGSLDTAGSAEFFSPTLFTFFGSQNGWLSVSVGAGMSHEYTYFYRTADGGLTWKRLHDPTASSHLQGCCKTGISFSSSQNGLITMTQGAYAGPYIQLTGDGGLTWEHTALTLPPEMDQVDFPYCDTHSPYFFDYQAVYFAMACKVFDSNGGGTNYLNFLYASRDGGLTWETSPLPAAGLHMLDSKRGYAAGPEVHFTPDGGQTWEYRSTLEAAETFHFIDEQHGWAVAGEGEVARLFATQNGGLAWTELFPVIGE